MNQIYDLENKKINQYNRCPSQIHLDTILVLHNHCIRIGIESIGSSLQYELQPFHTKKGTKKKESNEDINT